MNVGFIGFGEAAYNIALGLYGEGLHGIKAHDALQNDPMMGKLVHKRAEEAHVELVDSSTAIAQWADVIFAAVPSSFTLGVCEEIKGVLKPGQHYVDVSASPPAIKKTIWEEIKATGVLFTDAAMLGSLPKKKHQVPLRPVATGLLPSRKPWPPTIWTLPWQGKWPVPLLPSNWCAPSS